MIILKWVYQIALASCFLISYVTTSLCKKEYTDKSGSISSENGSCDYTIKVDVDWKQLSFRSFNVDGDMPGCSKDRVEIWTGCNRADYYNRKLATFCSSNMVSNLPHDIYTSERCIKIRLITKYDQISTSEFTLNYSTGNGMADGIYTACGKKDMHGSSGIMASPRWPERFLRHDLPNRDCKWHIVTSKSNFIQINAMDVDFAGRGDCTYNNHMKIKGEYSVNDESSLSSSYCSRTNPFTLSTKFYVLDVELKGYYTPKSSERGFVLGYVVYKNGIDKPSAPMKWYTILGIVVVIVIIGIAAFCIFRKYRARSSQASQRNVATSFDTGNNMATVPLVKKDGYPQQPIDAPQQPYAAPPQQPYPVAPPQQPYTGAPQQPYPVGPQQPNPVGQPAQQYPSQLSYIADAPPPYPGPPMVQPYPAASTPHAPIS